MCDCRSYVLPGHIRYPCLWPHIHHIWPPTGDPVIFHSNWLASNRLVSMGRLLDVWLRSPYPSILLNARLCRKSCSSAGEELPTDNNAGRVLVERLGRRAAFNQRLACVSYKLGWTRLAGLVWQFCQWQSTMKNGWGIVVSEGSGGTDQ